VIGWQQEREGLYAAGARALVYCVQTKKNQKKKVIAIYGKGK